MTENDREYLERLNTHGASTYGAMASAQGWSPTRSWRVEESLFSRDLIRRVEHGRSEVIQNSSG